MPITPAARDTLPIPSLLDHGTDGGEQLSQLLGVRALGDAAEPLNRASDTLVFLADALGHLLPLVDQYREAVSVLRNTGETLLSGAIAAAEERIGLDFMMRELPECVIEAGADVRYASDVIGAATRHLEAGAADGLMNPA
ncbi:hypothetical protein EV659_10164 [Rhodothalassium salexigens DSM 2132]|uniref:Uncharacterized protein n=1 Tax=Rhodothalassium salexigens DSM 2132 TaxID=1188247 RepID=A0A4R2PT47_RHOSA|nr:hypothetical protein [Rhodothalassium salexigens]MBB4210003.1 hypothetical protein [Rhodothalassium salexigens DSM 2132]MBK1637625.1 hypothetical protein [Rhodothalassium salexigens DSM 2132]TCP38168.1 hypothetical protein EV659_10164 [Rhodothalassium salexigens DSM 2132]